MNAVRSWSSFHNKLPDSNNNKIPIGLRRIMLHSHLYRRVKDLCKDIPFIEIESNDAVNKICNALNKRDGLSVVSNAYTVFFQVLSTKRGNNETYRNFDSRFAASVANLNSQAANTLPESLTAFILFVYRNLDSNQRTSILAAATPQNTGTSENTSTQQLLSSIQYDSIASVLRQCDRAKPSTVLEPIRANIANFRKGARKGRKYTTQQLAEVKARSKCREWKE